MKNRIRRLVELHLILGLQGDVVLRVAVDRLPLHVLRAGFDGTFNDRLEFRRQCLELRLVEADLKLLGVLVVALQHADLGHVGKAECAIRRRVVELGCVEQTAVHGCHDFAAWKRVHRSAHGREQVNRDADGAELQAFEIIDGLDGLLVPTQRLRVERRIGERHHVGADRLVKIFSSSALPPPYLCQESSMLASIP